MQRYWASTVSRIVRGPIRLGSGHRKDARTTEKELKRQKGGKRKR